MREFLSAECYPKNIAISSENLYLETPAYGGHVGFVTESGMYYHEKRATEFLASLQE